MISWYSDHHALLGREASDGMIVASPNALHLAMGTLAVVEAVKQAARSGGRISPSHIVEQAA
jgi:predicted dehydrogenase